MSLIQNGPREFHGNEVTYPPGTEIPLEVESYFADEAFVANHFLVDQLSDSFWAGAKPSRYLGSEERRPREEVLEDLNMPERYGSEDVWAFSPEGFEEDILDIVFSDSFQNLRGKAQHGPITHFVNRFGVSRFEHSIDALFTLRVLETKSDVDLEPGIQVYTVAHDIGHGAGSHWSEMAVGEDYETHEDRVKQVLEAEGLWKDIKQEYGDITSHDYDILDASKPDLSIDRLSYILKDATRLKGTDGFNPYDHTTSLPGERPEEDSFNWTDIGRILDKTEIHEDGDGRRGLVVTDEEVGEDISEIYMDLEEKIYFNPGYDAFNRGFADAAKIALHNQSITEEELFSLPDREAINLMASRDSEARDHLENVFEHFLYGEGLERVDTDPDINVKLRRDVVDPKIREYKAQRLSEMDRASEYSEDLRQRIESHKGRNGEEIGFDVIGWDYPEIEPYSPDGKIGAISFKIGRIVQPSMRTDRGYWEEKKKEYHDKGKEELGFI